LLTDIIAMKPIASDRQLAKAGLNTLPTLITSAGDRAAWRFIEFFTANIRNANTRRAYARAVGDFFGWCDTRRISSVNQISPTVVAAYVEQLGDTHAKPSVKQHLAAVRMLFDWLVVGHVLDASPAHAVRGPKHVIKRGKTPVLTREETRELLDAIESDDIAGLRDRALIGVLVFSFARIGAALTLKVDDYFPEGKRWKLRLHEKGGKEHVVPVHHTLEEYLDAYLAAAAIREEKKGPLFRTLSTPNEIT
jgi:integrase/recombinase XerD